MSKKVAKDKTTGDTVSEDTNKKSNKINDGKCCRCISRKALKCTCKKSEKYNKYVARKFSCNCFKYND